MKGNVKKGYEFCHRYGNFPVVSCGMVLIQQPGPLERYNFVNLDGDIISSEWWYMANPFKHGVAKVQRGDMKCNYIDTHGNILSDLWWDRCCDFSEGFGKVAIDDKVNHIDSSGKILSRRWWSAAHDFKEGFAVVDHNWRESNWINKDGDFLCHDWWSRCRDFRHGAASVIRKDGKANFVNVEGRLISNHWWNDVSLFFHEGFGIVCDEKGRYNYMDKEGNLLLKENVTLAFPFINGAGLVHKYGREYCVLKDGTLIESSDYGRYIL